MEEGLSTTFELVIEGARLIDRQTFKCIATFTELDYWSDRADLFCLQDTINSRLFAISKLCILKFMYPSTSMD